jgi:hypothetical protein
MFNRFLFRNHNRYRNLKSFAAAMQRMPLNQTAPQPLCISVAHVIDPPLHSDI